MIDLRSDTVTRPTPEMRRAIAEAEVGDDALGDDPTVRRLEEEVARLLGKEKALFFPSGIMANQSALAVLGSPGSEVLLDPDAHILRYEEGAAAALTGLQLRGIPRGGEGLEPEEVERAIPPPSKYRPLVSVLALENTHLESGGTILPVEKTRALAGVARDHGLGIHLDGARLWHAEAETGTGVDEYAAPVDTVMVALSKGLGAPVGSVLAGPGDLIERAWRVRRRFGGGMRQSGILAAAGLYALERHRRRLVEDHVHARRLAEGISALPGLAARRPPTNIVLIDLEGSEPDPGKLANFLAERRILMLPFGPSRLRAVTHSGVDGDEIEETIEVFREWAESRGFHEDMA